MVALPRVDGFIQAVEGLIKDGSHPLLYKVREASSSLVALEQAHCSPSPQSHTTSFPGLLGLWRGAGAVDVGKCQLLDLHGPDFNHDGSTNKNFFFQLQCDTEGRHVPTGFFTLSPVCERLHEVSTLHHTVALRWVFCPAADQCK